MELITTTFPDDERFLKKHIEVVHSHGTLGLLDKRIWNELLLHAYPSLLTHTRFEIKYSVLLERLRYDSGDRKLIKDSLKKLARTQIEFIDSDDDGKELSWQVMNHISAPKIRWGADSFSYGYDHGLPELLYDPKTYALINQASEERFNSKYTLNLYENSVRYKAHPGYPGLTPQWPLEIFHKFMGTEGVELYERYAELNRRVIKPSVKEINEKSDIHLTFIPLKEGRKIVGVQFKVVENPKNDQLKIPGTEEKKHTAEILKKPIVQKCIKLGAGEGLACLWYKQYGEAYLTEKIIYTEKNIKAGTIKKTPGACLTWAVEKDIKDKNPLLESGKKRRKIQAKNLEIEREQRAQSQARSNQDRLARNQAKEAVIEYLVERTEVKQAALRDEFESIHSDFIDKSIFKREEVYHCWIAELKDLGNPYPMIRGARKKSETLVSMDLNR